MDNGDRQEPLFGADTRSKPERAPKNVSEPGDDEDVLEPPAAGPGQLTLDPAFDYRSARRTRGTRSNRLSPPQVFAALDLEQRLAGAAAIGMIVSLVFPWWQAPGDSGTVSPGLAHFAFVELAIVLICVSVLLLLYRRAEGRVFHLPLSDGTLAAGAGVWCCFLLIYRMFDSPERAIDGVQRSLDPHWGIVLAFAFAVLLLAAGIRGRQRHHAGESEAVAADEDATPTVPLRAPRRVPTPR